MYAGVLGTVKPTALLGTPPTVTMTGPEVAPAGTGVMIAVSFQFVGAAITPLKVTSLDPWLPPKFEPDIVTEVPTGPEAGERLMMFAGAVIVMVAAEAKQLFASLDSATEFPSSAQAPKKYVPAGRLPGIVTVVLPLELALPDNSGTERAPVRSWSVELMVESKER